MVTFAAFWSVSGPAAIKGPPGIMLNEIGPSAVIAAMDSSGAASPGSTNPIMRWLPSQNGFFAEAPHRQSDARGWLTTSAPVSICSSPVAIRGPLGAVNTTFAGWFVGRVASLKDIPPTPV
jgi:hypothetical protein